MGRGEAPCWFHPECGLCPRDRRTGRDWDDGAQGGAGRESPQQGSTRPSTQPTSSGGLLCQQGAGGGSELRRLPPGSEGGGEAPAHQASGCLAAHAPPPSRRGRQRAASQAEFVLCAVGVWPPSLVLALLALRHGPSSLLCFPAWVRLSGRALGSGVTAQSARGGSPAERGRGHLGRAGRRGPHPPTVQGSVPQVNVAPNCPPPPASFGVPHL